MSTELDLGWLDPGLGALQRQESGMGSGLCRAIATRMGIDVVLVRVAFALLALSGGLGVALYAWGTALGLLVGRSSASEFLEFCSQPAVRAAWRLDRQELEELARWRDLVGMKWGLDGAAREAYGLGAGTEQNSLRYSVDRILLGGVLDSDAQVPTGVVPYPVGEAFLGLVARTGDLVDRLAGYFAPAAR